MLGGMLSPASIYFSPAHSLFLLVSALFLRAYSPHGSRGRSPFRNALTLRTASRGRSASRNALTLRLARGDARPPETHSLSAWPVGTQALPRGKMGHRLPRGTGTATI